MGGRASKRAANRSKRPSLARKAKTLTPKTAAQRKRTGLTPKKKSLLDSFDRKKHGSLRQFCRKRVIPESSARRYLSGGPRARRERDHAEIVKIVKKMALSMRRKHQSCRISAREIKANAGDASRYSTRHINRIIKQELGLKPRRRPQTGQPNAPSTPSQMRTINAHQRHF